MRNYMKIPLNYKHLEHFLESCGLVKTMFFKICQVLCTAVELQSAQISLCWPAKPLQTPSYGSKEAASSQASTSMLEGAAWIKFWLQEVNFALLFPIHPTQQPGLLVSLFLVIVILMP